MSEIQVTELPVLDTDPSGLEDGAMYVSALTGKMRALIEGVWVDLT